MNANMKPTELLALYERGVNISAYMRRGENRRVNTEHIIEVAYDLQAGSYIAAMKDADAAEFNQKYASELASTVLKYCNPASICEAGVGEGTTLGSVLASFLMEQVDVEAFGFDISWSRIALARQWLQERGIANATLFTGSLMQIPLADNSIDVVYTSHSIEPNGGNEQPILQELHRIARKYLILLEPGYELADGIAKRRMESHGYCTNLAGTCEALGYRVVEHRLFPWSFNPLNPTALTVISKEPCGTQGAAFVLACPIYKTALKDVSDGFFSREAMMVFPRIGGIACLRSENGIIASKYTELMTTVPRGIAK